MTLVVGSEADACVRVAVRQVRCCCVLLLFVCVCGCCFCRRGTKDALSALARGRTPFLPSLASKNPLQKTENNHQHNNNEKTTIPKGANTGFQFKTHPNIDKASFAADSVLSLKDPSRPFPVATELGVLKWRYSSRDDASLVPLTVNAWPSASGGETFVNLEYESGADYDLRHVTIAIPLPGGGPPTVNQVDGDWRYDARAGCLLWSVELVDDTNRSGSLEFVVPAADAEAFYPIDVSFSAGRTLCDVEVETVTDVGSGAPVKYGLKRALVASGYQVV